MQIEFSPNQAPAPLAKGSVQPRPLASDSSPVPDFHGTEELQQKLRELPLSRTDKLAAAQKALSDVQYPPDQLLNGIAHLLAIHLDS